MLGQLYGKRLTKKTINTCSCIEAIKSTDVFTHWQHTFNTLYESWYCLSYFSSYPMTTRNLH